MFILFDKENVYAITVIAQTTLAATAIDDVQQDHMKYVREITKYIETDSVWFVIINNDTASVLNIEFSLTK